jgi:peptidoglycan/xylan/chitin deacetylase (PgdA/CDA1 family)
VGRTVAITFDDGPSPKLTPMLLDMLKERGIKATFFVVGQNAAEYPDILKRAVAEGHEIGNHSWSHPQLTRLSAAGVAAQMEKTNEAVRVATGRNPVVMRPPYGATNAKLDRRFNEEFGLKVIIWDVDPLDWKYRSADRVEREILQRSGPGSIILAHDIHPSTVAAMPRTLDALIARGYKFATVSQLIAMGESAAATAATPLPAQPTASPEKAPDATAPMTPTPAATQESPSPTPTPSEAAMDGSATR